MEKVDKIDPIEINELHHLKANHPFFEGHFNGFPIFPGAGQIDLLMESLSEKLSRKVKLSKVKRCKFTALIKPETTIALNAKIYLDKKVVDWQMLDHKVKASDHTPPGKGAYSDSFPNSSAEVKRECYSKGTLVFDDANV